MKIWRHPHIKELDVMNTNYGQAYNCYCPPTYSECKKDRDSKYKYKHIKRGRRHY